MLLRVLTGSQAVEILIINTSSIAKQHQHGDQEQWILFLIIDEETILVMLARFTKKISKKLTEFLMLLLGKRLGQRSENFIWEQGMGYLLIHQAAITLNGSTAESNALSHMR